MENAFSSKENDESLAGSSPVRPTKFHLLGVVRYKKKGHVWNRDTNVRDFTFKEAMWWVAHRYVKAWRRLARS